MMKITDKSVGDEQEGFQKGRGCIDQIFTVKILVSRCGMLDGRDEDDGGLWKGIAGAVIWTGVERGRGKEECALMVSQRVWAGMNGYGWAGSRLVWMTGKVGMIKCV